VTEAQESREIPEVVEPQKLNDAIIVGQPSEEAFKLPLRLGRGNGRHEKKWRVKDMTFHELIVGFSHHPIGDKDGDSILQGSLIGKERRAPAIDKLYLMGQDVDCGIHPETFVKRVQELDLTCIIHTTNSHFKTTTYLVENAYIQFCNKNRIERSPNEYDVATVKRFFIEEKPWETWVVDTITIGELAHTAEGKGVWINHSPMPKFRALFPLAKPFIIAEHYGSQNDAIALWKRKLVGLSNMIGVPIDPATLDPSRLFYLPRHPKGMPFGVWVTGGEALNFDDIPEGNVVGGRAQMPTDTFARAGADMTREKKGHVVTEDGFDLTVWAGKTKASENFDIAKLFQEVATDKIRNEQSASKLTVECPFDSGHSNAGDPNDAGCFVQSPDPHEGKYHFAFSCSHASCKPNGSGRDRLDFLCEAMNQEWFTRADLENPDYHLGLTIAPPSNGDKSPTVFTDKAEGFRLLNQKTAIVHVGGKTRYLKEGKDGKVDFQNQADASLTYAPYQLAVKKGEHTEYLPLLPLWKNTRDRREYADVTFDPSETTPQDGSSPDHVYNLWKGFAIEPAKPGQGSWRLMQRHWFNVMCNGDEAQFVWWCAWWADLFQNPAHKPLSSIVAIGGYGTGKSLVAAAFVPILGKHYTYIDDENGLTGNFNAHFETALLVDVAEAYFSGNMRIIGKVKSLITAPTMQFERKGIDKVQLPSYARFYQTANPNKENKVIFAEEGERRYYVTEVGDQHAKDPEYFRPLVAEIEGDGPAAMMRDLLALDISDVDLTNPPITEAFGEQVAVNMSQKEKWWMAVLETGRFPQHEHADQVAPTQVELKEWETDGLIVEKKVVYDSFNSRVRPYGGGETDERTIGKDLRKLVPGLIDCRPTRPNGARPHCFSFPPLKQLRDDFTAKTQIRLGADMDNGEAEKVTKADLQDPFFAAGYEMVADAVIEGIFGSHPFQHDAEDSDGDYIHALLQKDGYWGYWGDWSGPRQNGGCG